MPDLHSAPHDGQSAALWQELIDTRRELAELRTAYDRLDGLMHQFAMTVRDAARNSFERAAHFAAEAHRSRLAAPGGIRPAPESPDGPEAATGHPDASGTVENEVIEGDAT